MAVKIKLLRMGKIRAPHYRIVVADARTKRDGRAIETIGKYHPTQEPSFIEVDSARAQYWLSVGAQPTEPVRAILKVTGDWQRFRGEPGAEGTLRTAAVRPDKKTVFEAAAREAAGDKSAPATTQRGRRSDPASNDAAPDSPTPASAAPNSPSSDSPAPDSPAPDSTASASAAPDSAASADAAQPVAAQPASQS